MKLIKVENINLPTIPFGGFVPAGFPSPATDYMEEDIDLSKLLIEHPNATQYFRTEGDSMSPLIHDKSILIVDRSYRACHGNWIVGIINGEFTCKTLWRDGGKWWLRPENKKYNPILLTEDMDFRVIGVVTCVIYKPVQVLSNVRPE